MTVAKENNVDEKCSCTEEEPKADDQKIVDENKANEDGSSELVQDLKKQLEQKENELKSYVEIAQRIKAEFDNYKRRVAKEKEDLYIDVTGDVVSKVLPVIDNMERAVSSDAADSASVIEGLNMILKQLKDILKKEGVEEIEACGKEFDPNLHNAVMHMEDESYGPSTIVEVFQKGYMIKDKVLRHSMVKVAN